MTVIIYNVDCEINNKSIY